MFAQLDNLHVTDFISIYNCMLELKLVRVLMHRKNLLLVYLTFLKTALKIDQILRVGGKFKKISLEITFSNKIDHKIYTTKQANILADTSFFLRCPMSVLPVSIPWVSG